jgi:CRISPR-associated endonuclease Csn1
LAAANSQVLDETGEVKNKTDIRDITHLHHALDACVLGLASHRIPNNGRIWELMVKRNLNDAERRELAPLRVFEFNAEKRFQMRDLEDNLKEQIRKRLAEKRVVQHIPARMDGLRVEQNTWRVLATKNDEVILRQRIRQPDGKRLEKITEEKPVKLLGLKPTTGIGKLARNKGALIIPENYGLALGPVPTVVPFHKVWDRIRELKAANGRKMPQILRNGQLILFTEYGQQKIYRVFSIKNTARGIMLDIGLPDEISCSRNNNRFTSFLKNGMEVLKTSLIGVRCPTTSSA